MSALLEIRDLVVRFYTPDGVVHAVNNVTYTLQEGETLGVVGESGSGKSVHALSIPRLIPSPPGRIESGEVTFNGKDLLKLRDEEIRRVRGGEIAMVFQDPMTSLNPVLTVGRQISEAIELHLGMSRAAARKRVVELLDLVGIPDPGRRLDDYPHQFSGGRRQRVMIAMALSCDPKLLIADEPSFVVCDEPISALDVSIQAQVVTLLQDLQQRLGLTYLFIAHDLSMIRFICTRVAVMYKGRIVELAETNELYSNPLHPYTRVLLSAVPIPDPDVEMTRERLIMVPEFDYSEHDSQMVEVSPGHFVAASRVPALA